MKKLDRTLGLGSVVAIAIGSMIGGGIFVLPGLAAANTGPSTWLAYLLAGLFVVPAALSQSEMATAMPKAGGVYIFVDRSMGPLYGTVAGIGTWLAMLSKASFALVGISVYLSIFSTINYRIVAFGLLLVVVVLNIIGVKKLGKFQIVVVIVCAVALGLLIGKGMFHLNGSHFNNYFPNGFQGLLATTGLVFISYAGVTKVASIAEEIIDPSRNLPLAMLLSLGAMMILYSLVAFCLVGNIPLHGAAGQSLANNEQAIALLGEVLYGNVGKVGMAIIAIVALASMANAGLLSASRYPFAMSRDEMVPSVFKRVSERFVTPVYSIWFTAACMAVAIAFLPVVKIAKLASGMQVILFMAVNISLIILRETHPQWYQPKFRSPMYPGIQIFGIISCLALLLLLGSFVLTSTAIVLVVGGGWFYFYAKQKTQRRGVIQKMRQRPVTIDLAELNGNNEEVAQTELVLSLWGNEYSPESLLYLGSALGASKISVVNLQEIPDQLNLHHKILEETPRMQSLRRRMDTMSRRLMLDTQIDFIASHDRRHALYDYVQQSKTNWTLLDMGPHQKFYQVRRDLGWLASHLPSNLAVFQNEGFRVTQNILVLYRDNASIQLVMDVANNLAELHDARLKIISVLPEEASDQECKERLGALEQLSKSCTVPNVEFEVLQGDLVEVVTEESIYHELMLKSFPREKTLKGFRLFRSITDRLFAEVACSVLTIKAANDLKKVSRPSSLMLHDLLDPRTIRLHDNVKDKAELFAHLAQLFSIVSELAVEELEQLLLDTNDTEDTEILSTGVALLHANSEKLTRSYLGIVFLDVPLNTQHPEHKQVDLVVLTMGPSSATETEQHLRDQLKKLLIDMNWVETLKIAPDTYSVMRLIRSKSLKSM